MLKYSLMLLLFLAQACELGGGDSEEDDKDDQSSASCNVEQTDLAKYCMQFDDLDEAALVEAESGCAEQSGTFSSSEACGTEDLLGKCTVTDSESGVSGVISYYEYGIYTADTASLLETSCTTETGGTWEAAE